MAVTVCLHFERSEQENDNLYYCNIWIEQQFQTMPSVGNSILFDENELVELAESEIENDLHTLKDFYPRYDTEDYICLYEGRREIADAGLWNDEELKNGRIISNLFKVFNGDDKTPYISDVMEWRKHDDGIYYPHILVKLK